MTASVVVVTYRRLERLGEILQAWLRQTPDVWLCDCSKDGFKTNLPVRMARFWPDPGNKTRHAVATSPKAISASRPTTTSCRCPAWRRLPEMACKARACVTGIHGRTFHGPDYYRDTEMHAAHMRGAAAGRLPRHHHLCESAILGWTSGAARRRLRTCTGTTWFTGPRRST